MPRKPTITVGQQFTSSAGVTVEVVEYVSSTEIKVKRLDTGVEFYATSSNLRSGNASGARQQARSPKTLPDDTYAWIKGQEGRYAVRMDGTLHTFLGASPKQMKTSRLNGDGPQIATVWKYGVATTIYVHREVAKAFIPNPEGHYSVRLIKKDYSDVSVNNLRWGIDKQ